MANTQKKTQVERILSQLTAGRTLTAAQARTQGIQRLTARIFDLRERGVKVVSERIVNRNGQSVVRYSLSRHSR